MRASLKRWWLRGSLMRRVRFQNDISSCILFFVTMLWVEPGMSQTFQNLVPNGSFETYTQCPNNSSQIYFATPWKGPTTNSSDYQNACSPGQNVPYYAG